MTDVPSDADLAALLRVIREAPPRRRLRDHALFALLINLGLRPREALRITLADCQLNGATPRVRVLRRWQRRAPRLVQELPLTPGLARLLRRYVNSLPNADLNGQPIFPLSRQALHVLYRNYCQRAGVSMRGGLSALRRSAGVRMFRASGSNLKFVQHMLGQVAIETTLRYLGMDAATVRRYLDASALL